MVNNRVSVISLLLSLMVAGCGGLQAGLEPTTVSPTHAVTAAPPTATLTRSATNLPPAGTATAAPGGSQIFYDSSVGFQLDIPAGWIILRQAAAPGQVSVDTLAYIYSEAQPPVTGKNQEGPAKGLKIDVIIRNDQAALTLDQIVDDFKAGITNANEQVTSEQRRTLASGLPVAELHVGVGNEGVVVLAQIHGHTVLLGGGGTDISRFDEVANSLRPA